MLEPLETICPKCHGTSPGDYHYWCDTCQSTGRVPTETGLQVAEFMKNHNERIRRKEESEHRAREEHLRPLRLQWALQDHNALPWWRRLFRKKPR